MILISFMCSTAWVEARAERREKAVIFMVLLFVVVFCCLYEL